MGVREALLTSLVEIGGVEAAETVAPLLASHDSSLRNGALAALRLLGPDAAGVATILRGAPHAAQRLLAAEIMRGWPPADILPLLPGWLSCERDENICGLLLELATQAGDATLLPVLARLPRGGFIGFAAEEAACAIKARGA